MKVFHNQIVKFLLPNGQFGIAVLGGTDFVIHSTQSLIDCYLPHHTTSTRAILLLNLVNMFNEVSCDACHDILASNPSLSPIICFFNILYSHSNTSWVHTPSHTWDTIIQDEGFTQGNPLGPLFSALTLSILLNQINSKLL
jgi:hypothetical protein